MRRALLAGLVAAASVLGVDALADATQNRPDRVESGTATTITFDVATRRYSRGEDNAAAALWAVCSATVDGEASVAPAPVTDGWEVSVSPALGEHGEKRLVGCLADATLDRVSGHVRSVDHT